MSFADQYRALRERAGVIDNSASNGRLIVTGADRRTYLQGLLTNDIVALTPGTGCYAAYLTPQGRMISDMRVFELGDALFVDLEAATAANVRSKWDMFIFSEDVQIEDQSATTSELGLYGPTAAQVLSAALTAVDPAQARLSTDLLNAMPVYTCVTPDPSGHARVIVRSDQAGVPGFDVVVRSEARDELVTALLGHGAADVGSEAIEVCRVEAGRPRFGIDMNEDTIPLEAGIEDRAISLTKGCYVGQEVIIRVLHRGHGRVARRLVGLSLADSLGPPPAGSVIRSADRDVGAVTSAVQSPALGHAVALGYVHRDFTTPGTMLSIEGAPAQVTALPFIPPVS
jgi:folate-binding protein YgfZ